MEGAKACWIVLVSGLVQSACNDALACDGSGIAIHLNQVGFHVNGAKRAVISAAETEPLHWELVDGSGKVRTEGFTEVFGDDPVSGDHVHRVDFSDFEGRGEAFRIRSGCADSHPFRIGDDPYGNLEYDAFSYFYHNRSGVPIDARYAGGPAWARPAGHERDRATCRSGVDSHGNRWPGCAYTLDLSGGLVRRR